MNEKTDDLCGELVKAAEEVRFRQRTLDVLQTLTWINHLQRLTAEIALEVCKYGADAYSQKQMADALGVPASMLRGLKREVARERSGA